MHEFEGKTVIVTGAGRGIGRAQALAFSRAGACLVVNDLGCERDGTGFDPTVAASVVAEIQQAGGRAVASSHDVASEAGAKDLVEQAVAAFGGVDIAVNSAGFVRDRPIMKMDLEAFDSVVNATLRGTFLVCQHAARQMIAQKRGGRIINTVALAGILGNHAQANLSAAAGGVYGLTRTLAIELRKQRIAVNAIAPIARTRLTADLPMFHGMPDDAYGPHFVAPLTLFLASDAARELTGEVVAVAGSKVSAYRFNESRGILRDEPTQTWTAHEIAEKWSTLADFR